MNKLSLYLKDLMEGTRKLLGVINTYSISVGYKINMKSSFIILAVNYKREIRKNISIIAFFLKKKST